jgi:hypothetical protein
MTANAAMQMATLGNDIRNPSPQRWKIAGIEN